MIDTNKSSVAAFRESQRLQEEATQRGLNGLAAVAHHAAITQRMETGAKRVLALKDAGRHEEAKALMLSDELWNVDEPMMTARQSEEQIP